MRYVVNTETKEHHKAPWHLDFVVGPLKVVDADSDGFIKHDGGECPLPYGDVADLKYPGGTTAYRAHPVGIASWNRIVMYRPILNESETPEDWPKIGDMVKWKPKGYSLSNWVVVAVHGGKAWLTPFNVNVDGATDELANINELRPIRTAAQRAEDEAVTAMANVIGYLTASSAGTLYHAIRDGRIPGVTLTDNEDNHHA